MLSPLPTAQLLRQPTAQALRLLAPGIARVNLYANVYLLHTPQGRVLVDTGTLNFAPAYAELLRAFAPDAVVLTHSHIDHAGNAFLAARAGVVVLAHPLEHARLSGQNHQLPYPAGQPRVGALISRLHPRVRPSLLGAITPGQDVLGWQVVALPGHTDGQIGLVRGGVLLAADALLERAGQAHLPRVAYNWSHAEALATLGHITEMDLRLILPGHGAVLTPQQVQARALRDG